MYTSIFYYMHSNFVTSLIIVSRLKIYLEKPLTLTLPKNCDFILKRILKIVIKLIKQIDYEEIKKILFSIKV